jgi:coenzyme F420-reducing hydrogenase delta subunit
VRSPEFISLWAQEGVPGVVVAGQRVRECRFARKVWAHVSDLDLVLSRNVV